MYTVGQISKESGVSIRTLHYYERLGLLAPRRSEHNLYRLYGPEHIMRLQQIAVLKRMGFRLGQMKQILEQQEERQGESTEEGWMQVLENQIASVRAEQEEMRKVERLLQSTLYALRATGTFNSEEILHFIRELERPVEKESKREQTFTTDELTKISQKDEYNPFVMEWADILRDISSQLDQPVDSEASRMLASRIIDYADQLFHGDEQLADKYWDFIKPESGGKARVYGMSEEVMNYIEKLLEHYFEQDVNHLKNK